MKVGDQFLHYEALFIATVLDIDKLKGRITYDRLFIEASNPDKIETSLDWFISVYIIPVTPLLKALL